MAQTFGQSAQLVYDAARELLTGTIGREPPFHLITYSGGSRGHKANVTPKQVIHGSGPKGSDGCLVPASDGERRRLNQAVKQFQGKVVLQVKNVGYELPAELGGQIA